MARKDGACAWRPGRYTASCASTAMSMANHWKERRINRGAADQPPFGAWVGDTVKGEIEISWLRLSARSTFRPKIWQEKGIDARSPRSLRFRLDWSDGCTSSTWCWCPYGRRRGYASTQNTWMDIEERWRRLQRQRYRLGDRRSDAAYRRLTPAQRIQSRRSKSYGCA